MVYDMAKLCIIGSEHETKNESVLASAGGGRQAVDSLPELQHATDLDLHVDYQSSLPFHRCVGKLASSVT